MKALREFIIGIVLSVIGAVVFLMNVTVYGFHSGFYHFSSSGMFHMGTSSLAAIVLLMCILFFIMIVIPNTLTRSLMFLSFIVFVVAIILSLNFSFNTMSALTLFIILGIFISGLALVFKSVAGLDKAEEEMKKQNKDLDNIHDINDLLNK